MFRVGTSRWCTSRSGGAIFWIRSTLLLLVAMSVRIIKHVADRRIRLYRAVCPLRTGLFWPYSAAPSIRRRQCVRTRHLGRPVLAGNGPQPGWTASPGCAADNPKTSREARKIVETGQRGSRFARPNGETGSRILLFSLDRRGCGRRSRSPPRRLPRSGDRRWRRPCGSRARPATAQVVAASTASRRPRGSWAGAPPPRRTPPRGAPSASSQGSRSNSGTCSRSSPSVTRVAVSTHWRSSPVRAGCVEVLTPPHFP